ncbi:SMI1 / KNR4 family protein [Fictibacillus phosphorivorans]|uniref:SMI1 / KNR4 family protein n=1 Tax=Fictibacillus phosphorivorans TaxID=1221500 RepID=A0A160IQL0_9BACL|nr:YrhA family protein [Fictibacillus phosphorivorans]ANC78753.1 SMI1 / KNR4 family protein [Fictibacillus phosphorivorans]
MSHWKDLLLEIKKIEEKYESSLRNPACDSEIMKMKNNVEQNLISVALPSSYIKFLQTTNGLDFNGLVIYGVDQVFLEKKKAIDFQGFIETNNLWHENDWQKQYIFYGDSNTAWYGYDQVENKYVELDKPSGTLIQSFESFDSMLSCAFETIL